MGFMHAAGPQESHHLTFQLSFWQAICRRGRLHCSGASILPQVPFAESRYYCPIFADISNRFPLQTDLIFSLLYHLLDNFIIFSVCLSCQIPYNRLDLHVPHHVFEIFSCFDIISCLDCLVPRARRRSGSKSYKSNCFRTNRYLAPLQQYYYHV